MKLKCIFCRILADKKLQQEQKITEEKDFLVMLTQRPQTKGHMLVIPVKHFNNLAVMPEKSLGLIFQKSVEVAEIIKNALGAKAYTLKINNGLYKLEGEKGHVGHIHMHIISRYSGKDRLNELPGKEPAKNLLAVKKLILRKTRKGVLK